jgi:hypothetical protein
MDPDEFTRCNRYEKIALSLHTAANLYEKAVDSIKSHPQDPSYYQWIKEANLLVDAAFPEKFQNHTVIQKTEARKGFEWGIFLKILLPLTIIIMILFYMVLSGTTGDVTKGWHSDDVIKNSQYPKKVE